MTPRKTVVGIAFPLLAAGLAVSGYARADDPPMMPDAAFQTVAAPDADLALDGIYQSVGCAACSKHTGPWVDPGSGVVVHLVDKKSNKPVDNLATVAFRGVTSDGIKYAVTMRILLDRATSHMSSSIVLSKAVVRADGRKLGGGPI